MSDPAPQLRDEPGDEHQYRPMAPDRVIIASQTAADRVRGMRMASAASRAQKLWVSRPPAFAYSGLATPEPCAEPVATVDLLHALAGTLGRHVFLEGHERHAVALWIAHTWTIEWATCSPRLVFTCGPVPSGKSTALRVLAALVPRPLPVAPTSANALAAVIDEVHPTLLLDDAHTWLTSNRALRRLVALGHARETLLQNSNESLFFPPMLSVFSPCAMAISGAAPDDVAMRSIGIALKPALALERVEPMPADEAGGPFALLRARAARWARDQGRSVASRTPRLPASLVGSQAGNWRPLLAIAEDAGAAWIEEGRAAATALSQAQATSALGLDLLTDIRTALGAAGRITSDELVTALVADAERPWRRLRGGPVDARRLAQLLRPFGVRPRVIRTGEETFARGYLAADFAEPFARYLPPPASGSACVHA